MLYYLYVHKKITNIAEIILGYTFRKAIEKTKEGSVFVLQAANIKVNEDILDISELVNISSSPKYSPSFLEYNDVILISRGSGFGSFRSSVYLLENKNVIASSSVFIIRVKDKVVIPKYLSIYLNSEEAQKDISQIITGGSYIQSLSRIELENLKVPIPPINIQESIIELYDNIKEQDRILRRKNQLKKNIISATIKNLTRK